MAATMPDAKQITDSQLGRLDAIESRMEAFEVAQRENTAATLEGNRDVREVLELFRDVKGGIKVLGWLAAGLKWAGIVVGSAGAIYSAWHAATGGSGKP